MDILLIEDNPADARMVDILLGERLGATYKLSHCTSLGDAITLLHEYEFDAALLDLNLPDGAGIEAFDKIHQINEALPVVVLTGQEDDEVSRTLIRAGAQGYLSKNTLTAELLERTLIYSIERQQLHSELSRKHLDTRRAEERFRTLIQSNADAILVVTPEQTICFANPAAEELFETCSSELLGTPFNQSLHTGQNFEMTLGSSEQELTTLDARVASIDWDGQLCSLVTLRNITRRKPSSTRSPEKRHFFNQSSMGSWIRSWSPTSTANSVYRTLPRANCWATVPRRPNGRYVATTRIRTAQRDAPVRPIARWRP